MRVTSAISHSESRVGRPAFGRAAKLYAFALVAPFFAALLAVLHPRDRASRNIIWIFVIFFGAIFYIAPDSGADSVRYAQDLKEMHAAGFSLRDLIGQFFKEGSRYQDVYQPLLTYVVSLFTDQHWLLFAVFGMLFGYVYSRNIWFLIDRIPGRIGPLLVFLLAAYAFKVNIGSGLNGVRMWTALHVFVFGYLHFYATGKWRYLAVLLATPLIHFSFWLTVLMAAGYFAVRRYGILVYVFFVVSFIGAILDLSTVQALMGYLPLPIEDRAAGYITMAEANPDYIEERRNASIWFLQLNHWLTAAFFFIITSWMVWRGCLRKDGLLRSLLVFGMLLYGVINLVSYIPSLGRFYSLAEMLLLAALILFLAAHTKWVRLDRLVFAGASPLLAISLALGVRFMLGFASIWLVMGNFLLAPFVEADISLYELIFYVMRGMR